MAEQMKRQRHRQINQYACLHVHIFFIETEHVSINNDESYSFIAVRIISVICAWLVLKCWENISKNYSNAYCGNVIAMFHNVNNIVTFFSSTIIYNISLLFFKVHTFDIMTHISRDIDIQLY